MLKFLVPCLFLCAGLFAAEPLHKYDAQTDRIPHTDPSHFKQMTLGEVAWFQKSAKECTVYIRSTPSLRGKKLASYWNQVGYYWLVVAQYRVAKRGELLTRSKQVFEVDSIMELATTALIEAVATDPMNPWANENLGACYEYLYKDVAAEECYRAALKLKSSLKPARRGLIRIRKRKLIESACKQVGPNHWIVKVSWYAGRPQKGEARTCATWAFPKGSRFFFEADLPGGKMLHTQGVVNDYGPDQAHPDHAGTVFDFNPVMAKDIQLLRRGRGYVHAWRIS